MLMPVSESDYIVLTTLSTHHLFQKANYGRSQAVRTVSAQAATEERDVCHSVGCAVPRTDSQDVSWESPQPATENPEDHSAELGRIGGFSAIYPSHRLTKPAVNSQKKSGGALKKSHKMPKYEQGSDASRERL
jgi:hypothetical protein